MKFIPRETLARLCTIRWRTQCASPFNRTKSSFVHSSFGAIRAIVSAEAIEALWTRGGGPSAGQSVVDVHRGKLERMIFEKFAAKHATDHGLIQTFARRRQLGARRVFEAKDLSGSPDL